MFLRFLLKFIIFSPRVNGNIANVVRCFKLKLHIIYLTLIVKKTKMGLMHQFLCLFAFHYNLLCQLTIILQKTLRHWTLT